MKKNYESPRMDVCRFEAEDVMTLSELFGAFSDDKDNTGNWLLEWN